MSDTRFTAPQPPCPLTPFAPIAVRPGRWKRFGATLLLALAAGMLANFGPLGCAQTPDAESLTLQDDFEPTLSPGDTTEALLAVRKARNAQGRMTTQSDYTQFDLVSDDETVVKVVASRRLLGLKAGETYVTARDRNSNLDSPRYRVTVE